jgi:DNA-binding response OmpR family regulator
MGTSNGPDHARDVQPPILVVDHNRRNLELLAQFLGQAGYSVILACDAEEFGRALDETGEFGLALIDLAGFDRRVWDLCEQVRTRGVPLLVISPKQSVAIEKESLAHGASGVLIKPLVVRELLALIHRLLEE